MKSTWILSALVVSMFTFGSTFAKDGNGISPINTTPGSTLIKFTTAAGSQGQLTEEQVAQVVARIRQLRSASYQLRREIGRLQRYPRTQMRVMQLRRQLYGINNEMARLRELLSNAGPQEDTTPPEVEDMDSDN